ncbi:MAG: hypothetical protein H6751_14015 [Candidatus Omnitrophica bacterium]|nr:hypothetical protein [Candidatus Omnitrophota bacterium]
MSQKTTPFFVMLLVGLSLVAPSYAQFDSGSDGSDGALFMPSASGTVTMDVPEPDGIFNFTTVDIQNGATLQFNQNSLNTPVYILATGAINVAGTINVSGKSGTGNPPVGGLGGPGGYPGGVPGISGSPSGDGQGPGAGKRGNNSGLSGRAAYGGPAAGGSRTADGQVYGSPLLVPLVGGSGGGGYDGQPGNGGAGGGGAILLASNVEVFVPSGGRIDAQGGNGGSAQDGSGGAVRIVAPVVRGSGTIDIRGGGGGFGGHGRARVDVIDRRQLQFTVSPIQGYSVGGFMQVFPDPLPRLDVVHVAGKDIPEGTTEAVLVTLPLNSPATQEVRVQGRDFTGLVPIRVVLTPDSGSSVIADATIDMSGGNSAEVSLMMGFPVNTPVAVNAFTR